MNDEIKKIFADFGRKGGKKTAKRGKKYYAEIAKKRWICKRCSHSQKHHIVDIAGSKNKAKSIFCNKCDSGVCNPLI